MAATEPATFCECGYPITDNYPMEYHLAPGSGVYGESMHILMQLEALRRTIEDAGHSYE